VLADALEVTPVDPLSADGDYHLSFTATGWAAGEPEVRSYRAVPFAVTDGTFLHTSDSGHPVGFEKNLGKGRCIVISGNIPAHLSFFRRILERISTRPAIQCHDTTGGTWVTTMKSESGRRFALVLNLDHEEKNLRWEENGKPMSRNLPTRIPGRYAEILWI